MALLPLARAFTLRGGDITAVLDRNRIPLGALNDPAMLIEASVFYSAMEDMAEALGDPYFCANVAIEVAKKGTPGLREAATHASNLLDFLARVVVEVPKQVDNVKFLMTTSSELASFEAHRLTRAPKRRSQLDAAGVAFYVSVIKLGVGAAFDPKRLLVTVSTTAGIPPNFLPKQVFVTSDLNGYRISFPPEWLWAPLSLNWDLSDASRGEFAPDSAGEATLAYLRGVLKENIAHQNLSLNGFADICGMHPRRVQRILGAQGVSYSQMKDEVRQTLAQDLLSDTSLPIAQIALQAGLSGPAALDRAFRRWTGMTPTEYRTAACAAKGISQQGRVKI